MREMGIGIYPTGGETADVGDLVRTIIVDSTVTCRMKRSDVINNANIRPGDVIVGLASTVRLHTRRSITAVWVPTDLTSARHDVFAKYLAEKYPESYDHAVPDELVYSGKYKLTDEVEGSPINAGELVLSPTRTYAPVIKKILDELPPRDSRYGSLHRWCPDQGSALRRRELQGCEGQHVPSASTLQGYSRLLRDRLEGDV